MFVDQVSIELKAGDGGDGCVSFRRERFVPKGGPDGGDGGDGGDITICAREGVDSLVALAHRKTWKAGRGKHGSGSKRRGKDGEGMTITVPPGTTVMDAERGFVIKDLVNPGDQFVAAQGGKGGKGNRRFKSAVNQAPRESTPGENGDQRVLVLELKVIADVGLVGKPNAGKSTLLSRLSRARPEIASYPFTTKFPNLGRVQIDINRSFVMADIPGLIEGAHKGAGLGHEFLRHVERAGILVHLVEPEPVDATDPLENYRAIHHELVQYNEALSRRPQIVAVSKAELPSAVEIQQCLQEVVDSPVLLISAVTGEGLNVLTGRIVQLLDQLAAAEKAGT
jgi:GTP-binding protein